MIIINDKSICWCGAYFQNNGYCTQGHPEKEKSIKVRVFGAFDCQDCLNVLRIIKKVNIELEYIDVDDMDLGIQDFCDANKVDKIPHIQFLSDKGSVILEHIGSISQDQFNKYVADYLT